MGLFKWVSTAVLLCGVLTRAHAAPQSSANYAVQIQTVDAGGSPASSADYASVGSLGGFGGLVGAAAPVDVDRTGYVGQLFETTGLTLAAATNEANGSAVLQLDAVQFLDDGTKSEADAVVNWSFTAPILEINAVGIVRTASVSQDTPATVEASLAGWSASLRVVVLDAASGGAGYNEVSGWLLGPDRMRLNYAGHAGASYALDRSYNLAPPVLWVPQWTNAADASGLLWFTNTPNPATNNFWRVRLVP